ncbi:MAG: SPASM domain-containing protein [candidate division Zixibacteria bacterium]|nr:SPASM domain-containing protein [candidate division Zixibacteria bacterium]
MFALSRYNYFGPWRDGYHLAYNARSGAVALLNEENFALLQVLMGKIKQRQTDRLSAEEQQLLQQLQYGKFVHSSDQPETDVLRFESQRARYDQSSLGLVIAPTMACNMACVYCYESSRIGRMTSETMDAVVGYIEKQAKGLKDLSLSWYGGEPLLAMDVIQALTNRVLQIAELHGIKYSSMVITNGYLLDQPTVDRLRNLKVYSAQVTLDGPAAIHNRKRPLVNGRPSFDTIVQNLVYATTRIGIGIRVNIDKEFTRETVTQLLDELETAGLRDRLSVHFALMEPATSACSNISESCYDTAGFSSVETEFYGMLLERGFRVEKLPAPAFAACMAQLINAYVVDPDGDLFRCFNYIGDKSRACGNVSRPTDYHHPEFLRLFAFDPFTNDKCRECQVLPLCMGACPSRRLDRDLTADQMCESWRYNLEPMLDLIARSRWQQMQTVNQEAKKSV